MSWLSDICAKRHLRKQHLSKVGLRERESEERERKRERKRERERERERKMALLATYPNCRAHPACYLSPSPSLVPFPSPNLVSSPPQFSQPEASPACHHRWLMTGKETSRKCCSCKCRFA
jgi:hypothetical protein